MELSKKLHQGYRLFTVSFYTTQHLATNMLQLRTFLIEAVKFTYSAMPSCLKDIKLFEKVSAQLLPLFLLSTGSGTEQRVRTVNERSDTRKRCL